MTQSQLYQLHVDAKELMVYNDIAEVYHFLAHLADKYNLVFDEYAAIETTYENKQYTPPKEQQ